MLDRTFGRYRILARLGAGGMGEVYRARDDELQRELAIKVVGSRLAEDEEVRARLLAEARMASGLNHPHICTIYEVGEVDGRSFIAMEYVEGEPLSRLIPESGLPEEQVLRYGSQIADAVAFAHQHGIIHRDLKSSNVVLAEGGRAKVLDFGLAKQIDQKALEDLSHTTVAVTRPGAVMGTLQYLAPEALRGEPADARGDIWSLGVLLYELCSGRLPFTGKSGHEVSSAIQLKSPPALPTRVSPGLRAVVQRCLSKDPSQRYQQAGEVRAALEALSSGYEVPTTPVHPPSGRRRWALPAVVILGLVALVVGIRLLQDGEQVVPSAPEDPGSLRLLLSSSGALTAPVLSPDGKTVAYVGQEDGQADIYVRRVEGGRPVRLTDDAVRELELAFSHAGDRLAFVRVRPGRGAEVCLIPALGGDVVPVLADAAIPAWSPNDDALALFRRSEAGEKTELAILDLQTGELRSLLSSDADLPFLVDLDWSPNGEYLAVVRGRGGIQRELWIVPTDDRPAYRLGRDGSAVFVDDAVFTPDGEAVVYSSNRAGATNLWIERLDGSPPERLTRGAGPDLSPSVARSGAIAFLNSRWRTALVVYDRQEQRSRSVLTHDRFLWAPEFSPDGSEIAYSRGEVDGAWHVWTVAFDGSRPRQLTSGDLPQVLPRFFPDGQSLLYFTWSDAKDRLWKISREGGTPHPLTPDNEFDDSYGDFSPDGRQIVFTRTLAEGTFVHVMPVEGGTPQRLTTEISEVPRWSPDGQWIAFARDRSPDRGIWVIRPDGTDERQLTETGGWPTWWPDSGRLAYIVNNPQGRQEFRLVGLDGGEPELLGPGSVSTNNPLGISPDGRYLSYCDVVPVSSEIWMLQTTAVPPID